MDKIVFDRLSSFNLNNQQKRDLVDIIKYIAKYGVEWDNVEEIKKLIKFLNAYEIQPDGSFPDFDTYISKFDTLNKEFKTYIETHKQELQNYIRKEDYPKEDIIKLIAFLKKYEIEEDGTFSNFDNYIQQFDSLNDNFNKYVINHTEELKQYVKKEQIDSLLIDINNKFSNINTKLEDIENIINDIQSDFNNYKHIPNGGKEGQFIVADKNGNPIWVNHTCIPSIANQAYGIEWEKNSNVCTRIGNMELHKLCPIQNRLKGCLHDGKTILHWLNPDGWGLPMDNGEIPVLDGSMGDVGVAMTVEYFVKVINFENKYQLWISDYNIDGTWIRISPCIYGASNALTRINNEAKEEVFNACIRGDDTRYIGGAKNETIKEKLYGRPRCGITIKEAIEFCNNRSNGIKVIDYLHWCALQALFYIEYATFNSQDNINKNLTSGGFKQGGLGKGITMLEWDKWNTYNFNNPIIPTYFAVEHNVGNKSFCDSEFELPDYDNNIGISVKPAYFHGIHIFGDISHFIGDILAVKDTENDKIIIYKIKKNININDINISNIKEKCDIIGYQSTKTGYIGEFDLNNGLYFIPKTIQTVKYDISIPAANNNEIYGLLVGGIASNGNNAGFGFFNTNYNSKYLTNAGILTITELD